MPIIQSRVISLISAAEDALAAFERLQKLVQSTSARVERRQITSEQALSELSLMSSISSTFFSNQLETVRTVTREKAHFNATARRNVGAARRAENYRRRRGIMPAPARAGMETLTYLSPKLIPDETYSDDEPSFETSDEPEPDFENGAELIISQGEEGTQDEDRAETGTGLSIFGVEIGRPDALSAETRAAIDLESELLSAPRGHASTILGTDSILCQCEFCGTLEAWREHLAEVAAGAPTK